MSNYLYGTDFKQVEDVLAYLYTAKQDKLALVVLDRERLINEAWGKLSILDRQVNKEVDVKGD